MSVKFVDLDYKQCKFGQISWTDPKTKEKLMGDKVPMLFIEAYLELHKELVKQYKIKVIEI